MSLELALQQNTAAITALIEAIGSLNLAAPKIEAPAKKQKAVQQETPAPTAATEPAAIQPTAEQPAAPEEKAKPSEQSPSPVADKPKLMSDDELRAELNAAVARSGREPLVALLKEFGASKASEIPAEKRAAFEAKLVKLGV